MLDGGQFAQTSQSERFEELLRGSVKEWSPKAFLFAGDAHPLLVHQLSKNFTDLHLSHRFNLGAADRLPIGDDRECLEKGAGKMEVLARQRESIQERLQPGQRQKLIAPSEFFDAKSASVFLQQVVKLLDQSSRLVKVLDPRRLR